MAKLIILSQKDCNECDLIINAFRNAGNDVERCDIEEENCYNLYDSLPDEYKFIPQIVEVDEDRICVLTDKEKKCVEVKK